MAVDWDGSVFFTDGTTVRKIPFGGSGGVVKSGFSRMFGLDVKQEASGGTTSFVGADAPTPGSASTLKTWASDNPAAPLVARNTTAQRFATYGATVASPYWSLTQQILNVVLGNDNTAFPIGQD